MARTIKYRLLIEFHRVNKQVERIYSKSSGSSNVNEGKRFAFDLNVEPVDETLDLNVEPVDEENRDALNPVDEENHDSMNHVAKQNHDSSNHVDQEICDSQNLIDEENHDSPKDSDYLGDLDLCSICRGALVNENDVQRTLVTLKCVHKFHLDCIGSAYNAKGFMECPNCRNIEPGHWQFSDGTHFNPNGMIANNEEEEEEEDNDPGSFSQMIVKSEVCPFGCLGQRYPFDPLGRSDISMINAPMNLSCPSTSTVQLNPSDVWESTQPFLSSRHHLMVEDEIYRMIYGDRIEMGERSDNHRGRESNGNGDNGGSSTFGGNGNGNGISG
ncbi:unnamed protein product [Arabidopsis thaliana]|uniref:RING-type domain-containing protein n=1 Tax=Arabidopsis thaliana TaxID=3702 RepID=A0A5S9WY63_ARATH|nr:unnamed protein product [Arabidopsis thaliana]